MSTKEQMTLAAALAVGLATGAFWPVFQGQDWFWRCIGAVLVVMVSGLLTRRLGVPRFLQPLIALLLLAAYVTVVFAGSTLDSGLIPNGRTLDLLQAQVQQGQDDISNYGPPVPVTTGLVLLMALGVGAVALVVDLVAVVLDRAAVAGLPLLALFAVPASVLPDGLGTVPFVLGATGWMGMLLVEGSDRVLRWGTPMRSARTGARPGGDDSSLGRVGRRIGVAAVGAALVVPLVIPGLDTGLVGGNGNGPGAGGSGGRSNSQKTYNPITRLGQDLNLKNPVELFQYRTSDPEPDYLRMTTLDTWTGDGWMASELNASQRDDQVQKGIEFPIGDGGPHRSFTMEIKIKGKNLSVYWLPVPFGPTKVEVEGLWLWEARSQTVFSAERTTENLPRYDVEASRPVPTRDDLAVAELSNVPAEIREFYGKDIRLTRSVRDLAARLTEKEPTEYDKAVALQAYFTDPRNGFTYNKQPSQPRNGQDHLEAFLEGKQGFCEQYASAMAAMLRAVGIPSRVAVGFTPGSKIEGSDVYRVTTNQAHAWPEAWFAGTGWVRFEPTPAQSGSVAPAYSLVPSSKPGVDPTTAPTAAPSATGGPLSNKNIEPDLLNPAKAPAAVAAARQSSGPSYWVLGAAALGVLLVGPQLLTLVRRRRRWFAPTPLTAWAQLRDDASDVGFRWHDADSPRTAAAQLRAWRPLPAPAVEALATLALAAERARYAPPERQLDVNLRPQVQVLRAALQDSAPLRVRLRARFATPSTLRWAADCVGNAVAAVTNRLDDAISAVTRPLRRAAAR
jgi:transglutaminase-like putative cysteine protease